MKTRIGNSILSVFAQNSHREKLWVDELQLSLSLWGKVEVRSSRGSKSYGPIIFLDASFPNWRAFVEKLDLQDRALFLVVDEKSATPELLPEGVTEFLEEGRIDDLILTPFRAVEVVAKLKQVEQILIWKEVNALNTSIANLIQNFQEDLKLAERVQKSKFPKRFTQVRGFQILSRYLVGSRPGGDYFDLAATKDQSHLIFVLSDSSSYGLSSVVLSVLMRALLKLSIHEFKLKGSLPEIIEKIYGELLVTLTENDHLSLFLGVFSRDIGTLRFLSLGNHSVLIANPAGGFDLLPGQGPSLSHQRGPSFGEEFEIQLQPGARVALVSSGFTEILGGVEKVRDILDYFRENEMSDSLNELVYQVKSTFKTSEEIPPKDCSVILFDVEHQVLRLTPREPGLGSNRQSGL